MIGLGLSVVQIAVRQLLGFDPKSLFAASEPGVWYDPSDFSTMFQDSSGTTPVTAVEQPVGRILDKSGRGNHATQTTATSRPVLSARYNLLTKTEQFDDAAWIPVSNKPTVGVNATTSPIGTTTADKLTPAAVTGTHGVTFNASQPAGTYTYTVYAKNAGYNRIGIRAYDGTSYFQRGTVDLTTGTLVSDVSQRGTWAIEDAGNGWWKIQVTGTAVGGFNPPAMEVLNTTLVQSAWTPNGVDGIYIWGASLVPANQASLPYQHVNTATDYDADPSKFKPYLRFDGVDDWLVTPTITPGTDKAQVFAGVRKLSDAATGVLVELGVSSLSQGGLYLVNEPTSTRYGFAPRGARSGQIDDQASVNGFSSPDTAVLTALSDLNNGIPARLKRNTDAFQNSVNTTFGGGNFLAYPLYIGRRGGTTLPFNGQLYGLIVRFGANLPTGTIASTETWLNQRTGAY